MEVSGSRITTSLIGNLKTQRPGVKPRWCLRCKERAVALTSAISLAHPDPPSKLLIPQSVDASRWFWPLTRRPPHVRGMNRTDPVRFHFVPIL